MRREIGGEHIVKCHADVGYDGQVRASICSNTGLVVDELFRGVILAEH